MASAPSEDRDKVMTPGPRPGRPGRHRLDATSLIAGVSFVAVAVAYWFAELDTLRDHARILWPLVLLALGAALLTTGWRNKPDRQDRARPDRPGS